MTMVGSGVKASCYWKNGSVVETDWDDSFIVAGDYVDCFCIDGRCLDTRSRYGMFSDNRWKHIPLDQFPPEFRTHLLLLGVS